MYETNSSFPNHYYIVRKKEKDLLHKTIFFSLSTLLKYIPSMKNNFFEGRYGEKVVTARYHNYFFISSLLY